MNGDTSLSLPEQPRTFLDSLNGGYVEPEAFEEAALTTIAARGGLIVDAGGGSRFTKGMKRFESLFQHVDYRTLDVSPKTRPDIVADIEAMPFEDATVDAFICRSVLEHVRSPERAVAEMTRALKPGGQVLITVPSIYPYHARPDPGGYPDLWRFFDDTIQMLLSEYSHVRVARAGGPATAVVFFLPFLNRRSRFLLPIARRVDRAVARRRSRRNATFLLVWAQK
jgi:SAM-dependent methyltransferase